MKKLDKVISDLNATLEQMSKREAITEAQREYKNETLNIIRSAIRITQTKLDINPLVEVITTLRKEGTMIIDDFNMIYKDRPVTSQDFDNKELSDYSERIREYLDIITAFSSIDSTIGHLIYNPLMEKDAVTDEEKEEAAQRKELLFKIDQETKMIRGSIEDVKQVANAFGDKFIGLRNLVGGLLKAEGVVKGLASTFRGVSELPLASLKILFRLHNEAADEANQNTLKLVEELMVIRTKLKSRGGPKKVSSSDLSEG